MAATGDPVVCEALCFVQNQFTKLARSDLSTVMIEFYNYEEVLAAKKLVYDFATSVSTPNCPAYIERKGNNRLKACVDDLLTVYALLDVYKTKMPLYVAANLLRLPALGHSATSGISTLSTLVNELREQVGALSSKLESFFVNGGAAGAGPSPPGGSGTTSADQISTASLTTISTVAAGSSTTATTSASSAGSTNVDGTGALLGGWAAKAASLSSAHEPFTNMIRKPVSTGKRRTNSDSIKTIPRNLSCFCGRLDPATTEAALQNFLAESGIQDAVCRKLAAKNGQVFKTAAFKVSCSLEYQDLFYNDDSWPEGAELRDWYYRPRQNGSA